MILVVGNPADPVLARVHERIGASGQPAAWVDTRALRRYVARAAEPTTDGRSGWRLEGNGLLGRRPVGAVVARGTLPLGPTDARRPTTAFRIARMLALTRSPVANRSTASTGNFAKVHQARVLAAAGMKVPPTLVTGHPHEALRFIVAHRGKVLVKGLSSLRTVPEAVGKRHLEALGTLPRCPAMFQKIVRGEELRLTVIGRRAIVSTRAKRRWTHRPAETVLPVDLVERCRRFVADCGLVLAAFDVIRDASGTCHVLEMNPNPLITSYEQVSAPVLSQSLCEEVIALVGETGDIFV